MVMTHDSWLCVEATCHWRNAPGSNKGIVNDPIILTIYATGAPDLTLIDLPGITRVPVKGSDQKDDVEKVQCLGNEGDQTAEHSLLSHENNIKQPICRCCSGCSVSKWSRSIAVLAVNRGCCGIITA